MVQRHRAEAEAEAAEEAAWAKEYGKNQPPGRAVQSRSNNNSVSRNQLEANDNGS